MRVYIIDEVHMLSTAAFNALLKIIEEPPEHLLFILATTELHKVPATILSRCQRFSFRRLTQEDIASRINFVAYQENIEIEPEATQLLARLADGALRDGLSLLDQCASAAAGGTLTEEIVCRALGLAGERKTGELLSCVAAHDAAKALALFSELYASGKDLAALLDEMASLCRDLLMLKTAPKSGLTMLTGVCSDQEALALKEQFSAQELLRMTSLIQQTSQGFSRSASPRIDTELCILQLCQPQISSDLASVSARVGRIEQQLASGAFTSARKPTPAAQTDESDDDRPPFPDDADDPARGVMLLQTPDGADAPQQAKPAPAQTAQTAFWPELAASLRESLSLRERGFFAPNGPIRPMMQDGTLTLVADSEFVRDIIKRPDVEALIREKAAAVIGKPVAVRFALKGQVTQSGKDPMDALVAFGGEHNDIFTIK